MHHYEGAAGAERLVSLAFADGEVRDFICERGAEILWQRRTAGAAGYYRNCLIKGGWWELGFWHEFVPTHNIPTHKIVCLRHPATHKIHLGTLNRAKQLNVRPVGKLNCVYCMAATLRIDF